jgi:hypothetical protein
MEPWRLRWSREGSDGAVKAQNGAGTTQNVAVEAQMEQWMLRWSRVGSDGAVYA